MPGMTGMQFQAELLRIAPDLAQRIVFITGGATTPEAAAFLETTTRPCIEKPLHARELRAAVSAAARQEPARR